MPKSSKVRFCKTVRDNLGVKKKLKRVNITKLAYSILDAKHSDINEEFIRKTLAKNLQKGKRRGIKQAIKALDKMEGRLMTPRPLNAIGHKYVLAHDIGKAINWSSKLTKAVEILKKV